MWNYRIIKTEKDDLCYYAIHEVYYNSDGQIVASTVDPVFPGGSTVEELREDLRLYLLALDAPIINKSEIVYAT